jgi:pyruvate dehydrogenase E1 component alpha subunit
VDELRGQAALVTGAGDVAGAALIAHPGVDMIAFTGSVETGTAVYQAASEALERARSGDGPTLIEAQTYRLGPHTTADDPTRYRDKDTLAEMERIDPILRLRLFLEARDEWSEKDETALREEAQQAVRAAYERATAEPPIGLEELSRHVYGEMPANLAAQRKEMA